MASHKNLLLITTGGTIESCYRPEDGTPHHVPLDSHSCIPAALQRLGADASCDIYQACLEDSKRVGTPMLQHIAHYIAEHDHDYDAIVITHGTDTMPTNARQLHALLKTYEAGEKTIVFTGAMTPLRDSDKQWRDNSDGWENLRAALTAARQCPPGAYLVMDGITHHAESLNKQVTLGPDNLVSQASFIPRDCAMSAPLTPAI